MPNISVIVTVYNLEKYIGQCIQSLLEQSYSDFEMLLIDDGSNDCSGEICDNFAEKDNRIKVFHQNNAGVSVARNIGLENAIGKWIAFIDGDDYVDSNYLESLIEKAEETQADICIGDYWVDFENQEPRYSSFILNKQEEWFNKRELIENCVNGNKAKDNVTAIGVPWGRLYLRSFISDNKLTFIPGLKRNQDMVFNLYAFSTTTKVSYNRNAGYHYRIWDESAVKRYSPCHVETGLKILKEVYSFGKNVCQEDYFEEVYACKLRDMYYECLNLSIYHKDNKDGFMKKYNTFKYITETLYDEIIKYADIGANRKQKIQICFIRKKKFFFAISVKDYKKENRMRCLNENSSWYCNIFSRRELWRIFTSVCFMQQA